MYCCTPKALYNHVGGGGVSPQPPPVCSIHLDYATAATGQRHQCAHHTPATGGERESHRTNQVYASPHTSYRWRGESAIEPIKCMRSPPPATGGERERVTEPIKWMHSPHQLQVERRESHRANQVYALTTPSYRWRGESHRANQWMRSPHNQLQVERREIIEPIKCMRSPHTSYR